LRTISAAVGFWLALAAPAFAQHQIVCSGQAAGGYAAFPDVCRLKNGDLICVFYSGYWHISTPNTAWPRGGRIMAVRSIDNGRTWGKPAVAVDTPHDDRDPSIACLSDGTVLLNWFTLDKNQVAILSARSTDNAHTWSKPQEIRPASPYAFACSSPIRELPDHSLILGLYHEEPQKNLAFGATIKSYDQGRNWKDLALIGEKSGVYLDAETDVVRLASGDLLAALRSSKTDIYYSLSTDSGKTWGAVRSFGFQGHSPYLLCHSSGVILLAHRIPLTSLHWSADDGRTWHGPVLIDSVNGAYPSMVELPDHTVLCVYYEEGPGSSIRASRLRVGPDGVSLIQRPD
jgi:sialidase-1